MRSYFDQQKRDPFGGVTRPTTYGMPAKGPDPRTGLQPGEKDTGEGPVQNPNDTFYFPGTAQPSQPAQPPTQPPPTVGGTPVTVTTDQPGTTGGGQIPTTPPTVDTGKKDWVVNPNPPIIEKMGPGEFYDPNRGEPRPPQPPVQPPQRPPAQPSSNDGRVDTLWDYSQQQMANPSRYDSELVKRGMEVIQAEIDRMSKTGMRNISEQMAQRGLTGSSLEGFAAADLQSELGRYGNERAFNLAQDQARTWAQDSSSAFGMGLGSVGLGEQINSRLAQNGFTQQGLDLQGRGLDQQQTAQDQNEAYRRWAAEQGFNRQDRGYDQADLSMIGSLLERFGPTVVSGMGLGDFGSDWTYDENTGKWRPGGAGGSTSGDGSSSGGYSQGRIDPETGEWVPGTAHRR